MGLCMNGALNSVCIQYASQLWTEPEKKLWSDFIRTTFDLGAQRCLQVKNPVVLPPIIGVCHTTKEPSHL